MTYAPLTVASILDAGIGTGLEAAGDNLAAYTSSAWSSAGGAANRALFYPLYFSDPCVIRKLWWFNGSTATGNVDIGLYTSSAFMPATRVASGGGTAQTGTNTIQAVDITDYEVAPETLMFLALVADSGSSTFANQGNLTGQLFRPCGYAQQSSAYPLPSTATPVNNLTGSGRVACGVSFRLLVA